ncbi:MAG: ABC transporter ATP-binding protein [Tuberibacillus sp.]
MKRFLRIFNSFFNGIEILVKSLPLFWKAAPLYTIGILVIMPLQGLMPATGVWLAKIIVDDIFSSNNGDLDRIMFLVALWIVSIFINTALGPIYGALQGLLSDKLIAYVNLKIMKKSNELPDLNYFEDSNFYDDIQIIEQEANWRPVNLIVFTANVAKNIVTSISMLILLMSFSPLIAALIVIAVIPQTLVSFQMQKAAFDTLVWNSPESRKMKYYSSIMLNAQHAKEVRLFNVGNYFINLYEKVFNTIHGSMKKVRYRQVNWSTILSVFSVAASGFGFYWVILGAVNGNFSAGDILLFSQSILMAQQSVQAVIEESNLLYDTLLYMKKFFGFLSIKTQFRIITEKESIEIPKPLLSGIEFNEVSFKYPNSDSLALNKISFKIKPNETIALVGENGAGKTTIAKLLLRLYEPKSGNIFVDNNDIRNYDINDYRELYSAVFQDFVHYHLTMKENIGIGNINQLDDYNKIDLAASLSDLDSVIKRLPNSYNTVLGKEFDGGTELSGGEWQKVAIARAFMRNAPILLLDEPTSALDPRSEDEVLKKFIQLTKDKTVLLITHRLSAVRLADRIIVLKNGEIVQEGTHEELINMKGLYKELYELQAGKYNYNKVK